MYFLGIDGVGSFILFCIFDEDSFVSGLSLDIVNSMIKLK